MYPISCPLLSFNRYSLISVSHSAAVACFCTPVSVITIGFVSIHSCATFSSGNIVSLDTKKNINTTNIIANRTAIILIVFDIMIVLCVLIFKSYLTKSPSPFCAGLTTSFFTGFSPKIGFPYSPS